MKLVRVSSNDSYTFGVLMKKDSTPFCVTLELPWKENEVSISCIPRGMYNCKVVKSPRFGEPYEITNVYGRTHILFHAGNTVKDTSGCILLGESITEIDGKFAISNSKKTIKRLHELHSNEPFELEIF